MTILPERIIHELPLQHGVAFGAACCERLVPNYQAFWAAYGWGDPNILERSLQQAWEYCGGVTPPVVDGATLIRECMSVVPDTDQYGAPYSILAQNSVGAIISLVEAQMHGDLDRVVDISRTALFCAEYFTMVVNWPVVGVLPPKTAARVEDWIRQSPLVRAEVEKQQDDLTELSERSSLTKDFLARLREGASVTGINPLQRGLVVSRAK